MANFEVLFEATAHVRVPVEANSADAALAAARESFAKEIPPYTLNQESWEPVVVENTDTGDETVLDI